MSKRHKTKHGYEFHVLNRSTYTKSAKFHDVEIGYIGNRPVLLCENQGAAICSNGDGFLTPTWLVRVIGNVWISNPISTWEKTHTPLPEFKKIELKPDNNLAAITGVNVGERK